MRLPFVRIYQTGGGQKKKRIEEVLKTALIRLLFRVRVFVSELAAERRTKEALETGIFWLYDRV